VNLDASQVLARRLATQRVVGPPLSSAVEVVELLTCVQSQEFGHALWSLGMRCASTTYAEIVAAFDAGDLLRTHLLRPTWHLVAAADLEWILAATSDRVHQRNAGMYRQTGIDADTVARTHDLLVEMLAGGRSLTRPEIGERLAARGVEGTSGMRLTYLVMRAELDGLVVSGPLRGNQHTYALAAERLTGRAITIPEDPVAELWRRFVVGHGPTGVRDFARWSSLTLTAARAAAARGPDGLESAVVGDEEVWWDPTQPAADPIEAREAVRLVPLYDELTLSYPRLNFEISAGHPHPPDADVLWGSVIAELTNVGLWRRTMVDGRSPKVRLASTLDPNTSSIRRVAVEHELDRLAAFLQAEPVREDWSR
jgi:hypothetical protein